MRAKQAGQPAHLLLDIIDILTGLSIPYAVVGALAVSYYGLPRFTNDADAVIWLPEPAASTNLKERLLAAGYEVKLSRGDQEDPIGQVIIIHDEFGNIVDLLSGVRGMDPAASTRVHTALLLDGAVKFIAPEDLIAMKVFAGGVQDLADARATIEVSGSSLNRDLLRAVGERYGRETSNELDKLLQALDLGIDRA